MGGSPFLSFHELVLRRCGDENTHKSHKMKTYYILVVKILLLFDCTKTKRNVAFFEHLRSDILRTDRHASCTRALHKNDAFFFSLPLVPFLPLLFLLLRLLSF
jgi:hypothetical protein